MQTRTEQITMNDLTPMQRIVAEGIYSYFADTCDGRALEITRSIGDGNGFEVYRQMLMEYKPKGVGRSTGLLTYLMEFERQESEELMDAILRFEKDAKEVGDARGRPVDDDIKLSIITKMCPKDVRKQVRWSGAYLRQEYSAVRSLIQDCCGAHWEISRVD